MAVSADKVEIWHNPRCSKSRAALEWLQARGLAPVLRLYLSNPPNLAELQAMHRALGRPAAEMLRPEGKALQGLPDAAILMALAETPALIERPIVRRGGRAVIARPSADSLEILLD